MDFSISQCVSHGPNAGLPRQSVDVLQDKNTLTRRALAVLKRNGFLPVLVMLRVGDAPNIEVLPNDSTRHLIEDGTATDYCQAPGGHRWTAWLDGVRVVWSERGDV